MIAYDKVMVIDMYKVILKFIGVTIFCVGAALICSCQSENHTHNIQKQPGSSEDSPTQIWPAKDSHYVADIKCAECHQEIYNSYQNVAMSKSFYDFSAANSTEDFVNNTYYHEPSDNHYQMEIVDGDLFVTRFKKRPDDSKQHIFRRKVDFVVGSGNHVRTYLYRNENGELFQFPVVWYSQEKKWGMAPGYDRPDHLDFHRPITRHCMFCHNAYPEFEEGSDTFGQPHVFPKDLPQGIGCQRCHGPGSEHIRLSNELDANNTQDLTRIQTSIVNTAKMDAQAQDDVCFQCHLQPMSQRTSFVRKFDCGDYGYTAGERLDQFMIHFEPDRDNETADHFEINHHPYRLRQSKCFTKTEGGIRCTSCHDPHRKIPRADQAEYYRTKCFSCHANDDCQDAAGLAPQADCIACHMPTRRTTDVVNVTMTDHKIARITKLENPTAPLNEIDVPIEMPIRPYRSNANLWPAKQGRLYEYFARVLDDDQSSFDLLANEIERQSLEDTAPILQLLQKRIEHRQFDRTDSLITKLDATEKSLPLFQINKSLLELTDPTKLDAGLSRLTSVVEKNPGNANAWYNLGVAQARKGSQDDAISSFEKAISLRPNYVKPHLKIGSILALQDKYEQARPYFKDALRIDVRSFEAYQKLASVYRRTNQWNEAIHTLRDAFRIAPDNQRILVDLVLCYLDIQNQSARNPADLEDLSERLEADTKNPDDVVLIKALAKIESNSLSDAALLLSEILISETRRAEVGLAIAVAQLKAGSLDTAKTNFDGAKKAIAVRDRLSRVIFEYAKFAFEKSKMDN